MKLLHTADWHLGKTLKGTPLIDDQRHILNQILEIATDVDAVIIAGDVYDRAVPPVEAVNLFDETLNRLAEKNLPTLIIAGNHDSASRLNFGSKLFARQNIFIAAKVVKEPAQVVLEDAFGEVYFSLIPYFEPADIRDAFKDENFERLTFNDANKFYVDLARQKIPVGKRSVAVAHVFLTGGVESESERKFVGGAENVDAKIFSGYNYVALGHLHRSQKISAENIRYAGSPLKYSFDEASHKKSVTLVDIDAAGNVTTEKIPLKPLHDVRVVKGTVDDLKRRDKTDDYICAQLTERAINVQDKLAHIFPHMLKVEFLLPQGAWTDDAATNFNASTSPLEYFADFFSAQTGEPLSDDYRAAMRDLLINLARDEREA